MPPGRRAVVGVEDLRPEQRKVEVAHRRVAVGRARGAHVGDVRVHADEEHAMRACDVVIDIIVSVIVDVVFIVVIIIVASSSSSSPTIIADEEHATDARLGVATSRPRRHWRGGQTTSSRVGWW